MWYSHTLIIHFKCSVQCTEQVYVCTLRLGHDSDSHIVLLPWCVTVAIKVCIFAIEVFVYVCGLRKSFLSISVFNGQARLTRHLFVCPFEHIFVWLSCLQWSGSPQDASVCLSVYIWACSLHPNFSGFPVFNCQARLTRRLAHKILLLLMY